MQKLAAILLVAVAVTSCSTAPPADDRAAGAIRQLEELIAQQPANMPYIYVLATYHDTTRNTAEVVRWLNRLHDLGWEHGVALDSFPNTRDHAEFRAATARLELLEPRVNRATAEFTIRNQRELVPEGITWDPVDRVFYLSSIYQRKILRVEADGSHREFVTEAQDGMLSTIGIHIDPRRRLLWIASTDLPEMRGRTKENEGRSILFAYELATGRMVRKIEYGSAEQPSLLNDFVLLDDGSVLVTDTLGQQVLRLAPDASAFEIWLGDFRYPNGIALDDQGRYVYIADFRGITRVDLSDRSRQRIETRSLLNGIDGLAFHAGTLIGIQNSLGKPRVIRIHLDGPRTEILESKNDRFDMPTTGVVVGDDFYFIANTGLRSFNTDHTIWPAEKLADPVMMKIQLR
ncbi:MAG TPA: SMP-30/gluconolactonase/LRE family protein [Thermoanaerobaculia bacterium]